MITITFTPCELNTVLNALGELPYNEVAPIIQGIKDQMEEQHGYSDSASDLRGVLPGSGSAVHKEKPL